MPEGSSCCCQNGGYSTYKFHLSGLTSFPGMGHCQDCESYNEVIILEGGQSCDWLGSLQSDPCGLAAAILLSGGDAGFQLSIRNAVYSTSNVEDCKEIVLSLIQDDTICSFPPSYTLVAVGSPLSSIGDSDCWTTICPCEPVGGVPSLGAALCCYPNRDAPATPQCPCKCEPGAPLVLETECGCTGIFCNRCAIPGCKCPEGQECCPSAQGSGCECESGGGCKSGGCGGGKSAKAPVPVSRAESVSGLPEPFQFITGPGPLGN
jgi:hypothetical protein